MIRLFLFAVTCLVIIVGCMLGVYPDEITRQAIESIKPPVMQVYESVSTNPIPYVTGLGMFFLTVVYHKIKGKSFRESLETAVTKVTVIEKVAQAEAAIENPVLARAKARATRTQLISDQALLRNRSKYLPNEITKAEKDLCYAQQALDNAERAVIEKRRVKQESQDCLERLRDEAASADSELAEIDLELKKLEAHG